MSNENSYLLYVLYSFFLIPILTFQYHSKQKLLILQHHKKQMSIKKKKKIHCSKNKIFKANHLQTFL